MDFIKEMDEAIGRLCVYDRLIEQQKRDYGCGVEVSAQEIHVLEAIVNHPEKRAGELAQMVGLLKGTFSKTTTRLLATGFSLARLPTEA